MHTVLVAEDECEIRNYLKLTLSLLGLKVEFAQSGEEVVSLINRKGNYYSLVLLDIFMPVRDGMDSLKAIQQLCPDLPVIMMSAAATPSNVIMAMTNGARDFLAKPIGHEELRAAIEKALGITLLLKKEQGSVLEESKTNASLAFSGAWSQKIDLLLERIAFADVPVLLQGETGVGKEVLGRKLHAKSRRAGRPFLKLNCAALPSELIESELFGYEKGAFTGAFKSTPGKFEMAEGGTILLDEIGDMDFKLQAKLLQVIQDREFHRLGAKEICKVDVRVMAATHCDFDKAIAEGRFREDLYYRLNIIDIQIPPLRERRDEILPLAEFFLNKYATPDSPALEMGPALRQVLMEHTWPGNVRELENVMQKFLVLRSPGLLAEELRKRVRKGSFAKAVIQQAPAPVEASTVAVAARTFADEIRETPQAAAWRTDIVAFRESPATPQDYPEQVTLSASLESGVLPRKAITPEPPVASVLSQVQHAHKAAEAEAILTALNSSLWNRKQAASLLNVDYKALLYKMKKLGIGEKSGIAAG